jgi:hypothetical protein
VLHPSPSAIYSEFEAGYARTKRALASYAEQLAKRTGPHAGLVPGSSDNDLSRENYYHKWLSYVVPQMVWHNPRAQVGSLMQSMGGEEVELELAANRWIVDNRLREFLARGPATDMQYNWAVVYVSCEPVPGARPIEGVGSDWAPGNPDEGAPPPRVPWAPKGYRIPQKRYFEDALAGDRDEVRLQGHIWVRDKDDILKEGAKGGWNLELINDYASDAQLDYLGRSEVTEEVKRNEIVGIEVWYPEYDIPADNPWGVPASPGPKGRAYGTIFTLLVNRSMAMEVTRGSAEGGWSVEMKNTTRSIPDNFPRKPRPYMGSERGPYVIFGQYAVDGNSLPLGALTACEQEIRELNTDQRVAQGMMRNFKRLGIIAKGSEVQLQAIRDGEHEFLYRLPGITKEDVVQLELGGLTDQAVAHVEFSRKNLEGTLGFNDLQAGSPTGVGTATEQRIADSGAQARFDGVRQAFEDGTVDFLWRICECLYNDNRVATQLGPEAAQRMLKEGMAGPEETVQDPVQLGGERQGIERLPFNALSVAIQVNSLGRMSEQIKAERALTRLTIVERLVPLSAAYPRFRWDKVAEDLEKAMDFPGLGEMFANPAEISAGAAEAAMAMTGGVGGMQPRVASMGRKSAGGAPGGGGGGPKPQAARASQKTSAAGTGSSKNPKGERGKVIGRIGKAS